MADERISLDYAQALEDAEKIQTIINNIDEAIKILDDGFKEAKKDTRLNWFDTMIEEWESFSTAEVPSALIEMGKSKENISKTIDAMQQFER